MTTSRNTSPTRLALACMLFVALGVAACTVPPGGARARTPFSFAQVCDTQLGTGGYEHDLKSFRKTVEQINTLRPDFVLICGDLVNKANAKSFTDFKEIRAGLVVPCHCVPGNHDVGNTPSLESLERYRKALGPDYFAFEHKGYTFVCVNTQLWKAPVAGASEAHNTWFRQTLETAARKRSPVFVVGHYPLYTKAPEEKETYMNLSPAKRAELLEMFERYGVVAMLSGHTHRVIANDYKGIQLVTGQATSRTHGGPLGFRLWHIEGEPPFRHESVDLEGF